VVLKRLLGGLAVVVLLALGALAAWYRIDGQPRPETAALLADPAYAVAEEPGGTLVFTPAAGNGRGLLIFHGALIKPRSYAGTAAYFARRGYTVFIPAGAARLSIRAVDSAAARLPAFGLAHWFLIGHSMGGFASLDLVARHQPPVRAVGLWATAMPADFSGLDLPMLLLWGDRDGLMPAARLAEARVRLPAGTRVETVAGGNHQDFAMYTHQFFDQPGALGWADQIELANRRTAAFFDEVMVDRAANEGLSASKSARR
jgi:pimeloyl-ACP methyl ester carboxylesterase